MKYATTFLVVLLAPLALPLAAVGGPLPPQVLMPQVEDYTHMWWAEGFPSHTPNALWRRVIQTGHYAFVLDTATLRVPHFGTVPAGLGYAESARADNRAWQRLPPADLTLSITADGKAYRCTAGGKWTNFTGPRLIESGRFMQRADVTDLAFTADDGALLNVEARFETVAWPDRLGLILAARAGLRPIPAGDSSFGRVGGGFGLDGTNHLEIPHSPDIDPERFTLELWAFVPTDCQVSERTPPWLACKNRNEAAEGNFGIVIQGGNPQARLNIGGGGANALTVEARHGVLKAEAWNHLAMSYDGDMLRLYVNGDAAGERKIGRRRVPGRDALAFGRRQDNCGDGYHFRGVIDEIRLYDRALSPAEVKGRYAKPEAENPVLKPIREWNFRPDGPSSLTQAREQWKEFSMEVCLTTKRGKMRRRMDRKDEPSGEWCEKAMTLDACDIQAFTENGLGASLRHLFGKQPITLPPVSVQAAGLPGGRAQSVDFDDARGWYRVNLDGVEPVDPPGGDKSRNDAIERVRLVLSNPADREQPARLLFEKTVGVSITGVSAILRDRAGNPTGLPVQLSKNWHSRPGGGVYMGPWFHGFSLVRLPPKAEVELELTLAYGHWGGVAAASHAQLCLIGWGSNQLWDQSALGSWGESICYEPDQAQARAAILDVRPVMVSSMNNNAQWGWTHNVGGGDIFRLFDAEGKRVFPARMRTAYERQGPCLTEVTYAGHLGKEIEHSATVSLGRTDDLVRGVYRLRLDVKQSVAFSRFVIFQIGADTYSYTGERKMALGNEAGLLKEWETRWGGDTVRAGPFECVGRAPWVSLHEAVSRAESKAAARGKAEPCGAWANRGIVIRSWKARLGGKEAAPWLVEHGVKVGGVDTSTADIVPPPGVTRLEAGDFVEATFEHIIMPQFARDYYGPNGALRAALGQWENTWRMILREAAGNDRCVEMKTGTLDSLYPAVRIVAKQDQAEFTLTGGLGHVPVTFTGLTSAQGHALFIDGHRVFQSVHGSDYWQADYDPAAQRWDITYNVPLQASGPHTLRFGRVP